ncbi:MAG: hypothetical protein JXA09_01870 [Anaerolineae bacterium]|nr:hypothetical protein [Anaerolineae bacterium]
MTEAERLCLDQPAFYQIRLQGELDEDWSDWLNDLAIQVEGGITTLTGKVADQPALHGLLIKIRDLGLPLISIEHLASESGPA